MRHIPCVRTFAASPLAGSLLFHLPKYEAREALKLKWKRTNKLTVGLWDGVMGELKRKSKNKLPFGEKTKRTTFHGLKYKIIQKKALGFTSLAGKHRNDEKNAKFRNKRSPVVRWLVSGLGVEYARLCFAWWVCAVTNQSASNEKPSLLRLALSLENDVVRGESRYMKKTESPTVWRATMLSYSLHKTLPSLVPSITSTRSPSGIWNWFERCAGALATCFALFVYSVIRGKCCMAQWVSADVSGMRGTDLFQLAPLVSYGSFRNSWPCIY